MRSHLTVVLAFLYASPLWAWSDAAWNPDILVERVEGQPKTLSLKPGLQAGYEISKKTDRTTISKKVGGRSSSLELKQSSEEAVLLQVERQSEGVRGYLRDGLDSYRKNMRASIARYHGGAAVAVTECFKGLERQGARPTEVGDGEIICQSITPARCVAAAKLESTLDQKARDLAACDTLAKDLHALYTSPEDQSAIQKNRYLLAEKLGPSMHQNLELKLPSEALAYGLRHLEGTLALCRKYVDDLGHPETASTEATPSH